MSEKKILIVHDDASFVENLTSGLQDVAQGVEVTSALSAPRALGIVSQGVPDVIVVDAELVGVDGYAFTHQLKADPKTKDTPVVIVSLAPNESSALKARSVGAAAHLAASGPMSQIVGKVVSLAGLESRVAVPVGVAAAAPEVPSAREPMSAAVAPASIQPPSGGPAQVAPSGGAQAMQQPASPATVPVGAPAAPRPAESGGAAGIGTASAGYGAPTPVSSTPSVPSFGTESVSVSAGAPGGSEIPHVDELLRLMLQRGGSDLHLTVGSPPGIRQRGEIIPVEEMTPLTPRDTMEMILGLLSEEQRRRFETELELDFAYSIPGVSRFRANVFQQRNSMGAVFRVIPIKIPTMDELGLPKVCRFLADRPRGLVLVTGPTGSGKSTTLAAMLDHINETRANHIITLEDPIEFMHRNKKSFVNQREVGEDTHSFAAALKRVLRQDPDVILVGEMRDLETISAAITAAETGHLVLATLHTTGGPETVDRVIDVFPPHQQQQVRMQLSNTLEGVLSQVLLRSTDGRTRTMAMEIMLGIPAIANLIREGKTHQMETIIQGGAQLGMQTLDQHLKNLVVGGEGNLRRGDRQGEESARAGCHGRTQDVGSEPTPGTAIDGPGFGPVVRFDEGAPNWISHASGGRESVSSSVATKSGTAW